MNFWKVGVFGLAAFCIFEQQARGVFSHVIFMMTIASSSKHLRRKPMCYDPAVDQGLRGGPETGLRSAKTPEYIYKNKSSFGIVGLTESALISFAIIQYFRRIGLCGSGVEIGNFLWYWVPL